MIQASKQSLSGSAWLRQMGHHAAAAEAELVRAQKRCGSLKSHTEVSYSNPGVATHG